MPTEWLYNKLCLPHAYRDLQAQRVQTADCEFCIRVCREGWVKERDYRFPAKG